MKRHSLKRLCVAVLTFSLALCQVTWVLAGTTGVLSGQVTDESGVPVAGADVKVVAASQSADTATDGAGHFAFLSLAPDTYTLSIDKSGYNPVSYAGISIFADQQQTLSFRLTKALKEIAKVSARSSGALVKAGTTSDVYSVNASSAAKLTGLGGGGGLDNAYSAIASVPGAWVPVGQQGWFQSVYIRGGNYDQVGYEVDGVPVNRSFDNYPSSTASALGQQEVQVYTGANPANSESQGLAGFINQVIKAGTYPGFASTDLGVGAPTYYHKANIEAGGASPDRLFSYYAGFGGYNQEERYYDQNNGAAISSIWGGALDWVAAPGGAAPGSAPCETTGVSLNQCYNISAGPTVVSFGPGGFILGPFQYAAVSSLSDRENVINFHFGIPHHSDGGRDDLQLLYQTSSLNTSFYNGAIDIPPSTLAFDATNGFSPVGTPTGGTAATFASGFQYNGPIGAPLATTSGPCPPTNPNPSCVSVTPGTSVPYAYPSRPFDGVGGTIPATLRDSQNNGIGIVKLQYQKNFGSKAYLRVYGYSLYSNWFLYGPNTTFANFLGPNPADYELSSHTRGVSASLAMQLNPHNLLSVQGSYTTATVIRDNNTQATNGGQTLAVLVDSSNPLSGVCYNLAQTSPAVAGTPVGCSGSLVPAGALTPTTFSQARGFSGGTRTNPAGHTCGAGTCEFLAVNSGQNATYNNVSPKFSAASVTDEWDPTDRLHFNLGIRWDGFTFDPANTTGTPARAMYFNAWNNAMCVNPGAGVFRPVPKTNILLPCNDPGNFGAGFTPALISNTGQKQTFSVWQPRVGVTFTVNPQNVLRFSYGKYDQAPNSAYEQYNVLQQDLASFIGLRMYQYGRTQTTFPIVPSVSYNTDLSWEHQFRGTDISFKLTPFYRKTQDQIQQFYLDPKTNFVSGLNIGAETSKGVEFQLQKGDFARDGFSALLSYTYTNAYVRYNPLSNGNSILTPINQSIANYNSFTSFCAANASDARCGGSAAVTAHAAPCFTTTGVAVPTAAACTSANVANPYWNAPVQALFDLNGNYAPYNIFPSQATIGDYRTYVAPHVATLVLNYKRGKFAITPALQWASGVRYGTPLATMGVDPSSGCGVLALAPDAARYPYGAAGAGSAYDAQLCGAALNIPNPETKQFDNLGAFRQPDRYTMNLQMSYEVNPRVTAVATLANIFDTCSGGNAEPWTNVVGVGKNKVCGWITPGVVGGIGPVGNIYNPGAEIQPFVAHSYGPAFGSLPFNAFFDLKVKL